MDTINTWWSRSFDPNVKAHFGFIINYAKDLILPEMSSFD